MSKEKDPLKEFVFFNIKRLITRTYKSHLKNLSEVNQENLRILEYNKELRKNPELWKDMSFFDSKEYSKYRKRTLDEGNEAIREIEQIFDKIDFTLSKDATHNIDDLIK